MKVIDPGHDYDLRTLDMGDRTVRLVFVKREGVDYPGNVGHHGGTTMQEVIRALIDRGRYVNAQKPNAETEAAIEHLSIANFLLESRAARLKGRPLAAASLREFESLPVCDRHLHVSCPACDP